MSRNPVIESIPKYINYRFARDEMPAAAEKPWDEFRRRRIAGEAFKTIARDYGDVAESTCGRWWAQYLDSPEGLEDEEAQATRGGD